MRLPGIQQVAIPVRDLARSITSDPMYEPPGSIIYYYRVADIDAAHAGLGRRGAGKPRS